MQRAGHLVRRSGLHRLSSVRAAPVVLLIRPSSAIAGAAPVRRWIHMSASPLGSASPPPMPPPPPLMNTVTEDKAATTAATDADGDISGGTGSKSNQIAAGGNSSQAAAAVTATDPVHAAILAKPVPTSEVTQANADAAATAAAAETQTPSNVSVDTASAAAADAAAWATSADSVYEEATESPRSNAVAGVTGSPSVSSDSSCPRVGVWESSLCEFQENWERLQRGEKFTKALRRKNVNQHGVFANADLPLSRIEAWGFDYDYTLANYNDNVLAAIYGYAKNFLLKRMGYPPELAQAQFDSTFAIRGLHFDTRTGFLLKLDAFNKVQTSCCFLGRQRVSVPDIVAAYGGISVATDYGARHLRSLVDLFAKAEATLLADCIEVFRSKHLDFEPDYVYRDVRAAVEQVHVGGQLHAAIMASPGHFLESSPQLAEFLLRLRAENKFVFLLTNSPFAFVDAGMRFMLAQGLSSAANQKLAKQFGVESAEQWTRLFDVCITSARKPGFFTRQGHFRRVDVANNGRLSWQPVHRFERGAVYTEGSLTEFIRLASISRAETAAAAAAAAPASSAAGAESSGGAAAAAAAAAAAEPISPMSASYNPAALKKDADDLADLAPLRGHQVLYWGDHVGADLTAPWQAQRWRTAAVVPEIARELAVQASPAFKNALKRMLRIEALISYGQRLEGDEETQIRMRELKRTRHAIKRELLTLFNANFGSCFRTSTHRTSFFADVGRFADVYSSSVSNVLHYEPNYTFYAQRAFYPHERPISIDDDEAS